VWRPRAGSAKRVGPVPKYNWGLMKILIGADHAGFPLKQQLVEQLQAVGHEVVDKGAYEFDGADDYPDFSLAVARGVAKNEGDRGIIVCGSGVGASIAANKVKGARASLCSDTYSAAQGVEHDAMNILCLGGRVIGPTLAEKVVEAFLGATYSSEERHNRRLRKVTDAEAEF
jgi:ribose 5-phosphate isomerase B